MLRSDSSEAELARSWLGALCAVDSTSGREDALLPTLVQKLSELGAEVACHAVAPGRSNVLAVWGRPRVLLTTHLDTVPPFFAPLWDGDRLQARGACDAKGQIVAQWLAIRRLRQRGLTDLAWLGVVGEESDSLGARAAAAHAAWRQQLADCRVLINGEPTQGKLARGQRGVLLCRVTCRGQAAHSALPDQGRSAIWMLFDWLAALRHEPAGSDPELGSESWNFGLCRGGEAANSVPALAEGQVLFRTVPGGRLPDRLKALCPIGGEVTTLLEEPPMRFHVVAGFATTIVPYGSDAPTLAGLVPGASILQVGPGHIEQAHTESESVTLAELLAGADVLEKLGSRFLALPESLAGEEAKRP